MNGRRHWLAFLLLIVLGAAGVRGETRTWTDSKGKHKTQAEFVSYEKGQVTLRKTDGTLVSLQLTKLSREDQRYVQERVRQQREEEKAKAEKEKEAEKDNPGAATGADDDEDRPATGARRNPRPRAKDDEQPSDEENPELQEDEESTDKPLEADQQDRPRRDAAAQNKTTPSNAAEDDAAATSSSSQPTQKPAPRPVKPNNVINSVRGAVYRTETLNNLKQIAIALAAYEAEKQRFPTSAVNARAGQAGLSWRVALLPYLEEKSLYDQFNMNEPWDSEHNLKLVAQIPKVFRSPGSDADEGYTNYLAVVGSNTVISNAGRGTRAQDITDGTSKTATVVEVDDDHAVIWTQPADYEWEAGELGAGLGQIWSGTFFATLADGSSRRIDLSAGPELLRGLFTRNGGEPVEFDD